MLNKANYDAICINFINWTSPVKHKSGMGYTLNLQSQLDSFCSWTPSNSIPESISFTSSWLCGYREKKKKKNKQRQGDRLGGMAFVPKDCFSCPNLSSGCQQLKSPEEQIKVQRGRALPSRTQLANDRNGT